MLRAGVMWLGALLWLALLFPWFLPVLLVWPTRAWRLRVAVVYARLWSRGCLALAGIRIRVTRGREHLEQAPAVYLFNHTNTLDFFVNACLAPGHCLVYGKRELARFPFLGWMWLLGGHPMIRRHDREQWQRVLDDTERLLATGRYSTFVAPEGTRSKHGRLGPFKKGPFHLAVRSGAPLVPVVLKGIAPLWGRYGPLPGVVEVEVLDPISPAGTEPERLEPLIERVRGRYLEALGQVEEAGAPAASEEAAAG